MKTLPYIIGCMIVGYFLYTLKQNEDTVTDTVSITCMDSLPSGLEGNAKIQRDLLWDEVVSYLDNYIDTVEKKYGRCRTVKAATLSFQGERLQPKECLDRYFDVLLMVDQVKLLVQNKDKAKACFDPKMSKVEPPSYRGLTPSPKMKKYSTVARWINRQTFKEKYSSDSETHKALSDFADNFLDTLRQAETNSQWKQDPTINGYPHLWASAPWVPMYVNKENAGPASFRGGYAYAEILGPWGMLRIDEINGIKFQAVTKPLDLSFLHGATAKE